METFQSLHMNWRLAPEGGRLDEGSRRLVKRLLESVVMRPEHEQLQRILDADNKGNFEQESLGLPTLARWPFYNA